jgi:NAD(P)H-dependent flavin oxidoreductase YrpB (nitropropane dioxygenase family)
MTLVPEIADMLTENEESATVPIIAAGGIMDGRGVVAALALGENTTVGVITVLCAGQRGKAM